MPVTTAPQTETTTVNGYFVDGVSFHNMAVPVVMGEDGDGNPTPQIRAYANIEWYSALDGVPGRRYTTVLEGAQFAAILAQYQALYALLKIIIHGELIELGYIPMGENAITPAEQDAIASAAGSWLAKYG